MGNAKWPDGRTHSDWYENAGLGMEMQVEGNYAITMTIQWVGTPEHPDLQLTATAVPMDPAVVEVAPSVSTSCRASQTTMAHWKGLITYLLYQLDFVSVLKDDVDNSPS